jgi:hypothetical protein
MNKFESSRRAVTFGKKGEKPTAFNAAEYEQYALTGSDHTDPKLSELVQARKQIEFYQETGNGTREDVKRVEELEKQIAARIAELSN